MRGNNCYICGAEILTDRDRNKIHKIIADGKERDVHRNCKHHREVALRELMEHGN